MVKFCLYGRVKGFSVPGMSAVAIDLIARAFLFYPWKVQVVPADPLITVFVAKSLENPSSSLLQWRRISCLIGNLCFKMPSLFVFYQAEDHRTTGC